MHEYKDDVALSTGQIRAGDVCVNFIPVLQSLSFFNGLERIDTPQGSEFRKNSQTVQYFPDYLVLEINIRIEECDFRLRTLRPKRPTSSKVCNFACSGNAACICARWPIVTIESKPLQMEEGDNRLLYVMKIRDHNVPLSDHLILSVISAKGKIMSRMSARL